MDSIELTDGRILSEFFSRINLSGEIPDAVVKFEDGIISSSSMDSLHTIFCLCSCVPSGNWSFKDSIELGIPEIGTIATYLNTDSPYKVLFSEGVLTIRKGKGALKFRLLDTSEVSTANSLTEEGLNLDSRMCFDLKNEVALELFDYLNLTKCDRVLFNSTKGKMIAETHEASNVGFKQIIGLCAKEIRTCVYTRPLFLILKLLKGKSIQLYMKNNHEIIVHSEGQYWGIGSVEE